MEYINTTNLIRKIMMKKIFYFVFISGLILLVDNVQAQDFVYKPTNPAFGGDTFNHGWLMSSAQAQNQFKDDGKSVYGANDDDPVKSFADDLNRLVLSQLSRKLVQEQFGEDGLQDGTYVLGDYQIVVNSGSGGITVGITDLVTGTKTNVEVPYF
jgi:curli production assembly/transport component CsgF